MKVIAILTICTYAIFYHFKSYTIIQNHSWEISEEKQCTAYMVFSATDVWEIYISIDRDTYKYMCIDIYMNDI